jgi:hypothetical protein
MLKQRIPYLEIVHGEFKIEIFKESHNSNRYEIVVRRDANADVITLTTNSLFNLRQICMAHYIRYVSDVEPDLDTWARNTKLIYSSTSGIPTDASEIEHINNLFSSINRLCRSSDDQGVIMIHNPLYQENGEVVGFSIVIIGDLTESSPNHEYRVDIFSGTNREIATYSKDKKGNTLFKGEQMAQLPTVVTSFVDKCKELSNESIPSNGGNTSCIVCHYGIYRIDLTGEYYHDHLEPSVPKELSKDSYFEKMYMEYIQGYLIDLNKKYKKDTSPQLLH